MMMFLFANSNQAIPVGAAIYLIGGITDDPNAGVPVNASDPSPTGVVIPNLVK